jgi:glycosyltransferase involved in cell wall biosynthesis
MIRYKFKRRYSVKTHSATIYSRKYDVKPIGFIRLFKRPVIIQLSHTCIVLSKSPYEYLVYNWVFRGFLNSEQKSALTALTRLNLCPLKFADMLLNVSMNSVLRRMFHVEQAAMDRPVLLVAEPIIPGGIAVYTSSVMSGLSQVDIGHPLVTSVEPAHGVLSEEELERVQVVNGLYWTFFHPIVFRRMVAWAREQEVALIHGLSAHTAPVCAKLAQALNLPYIITVHHFQKRGSLHLDKNCRAVIAVSESLRENLVNDAHIAKELVRLIPAGIRIPKELRPRPAAYQQDEEGSVPLVSTFGKLVPRKDVKTFLQAAKIIVERFGANCSFVVSGDGPEETYLRKLARELKIDKQVTFCHGTAANDELLRDTDVYVQCSKTEGFGTMALQAMAHGVPVVATSTGGLLSLVKDGETGFLVPVSDHEALAARVLNLLTDHELAHRFGENARQVAATDYDLDHMMTDTINLYKEATSQAPVGV